MKFLFSCRTGYGHFHPLVPLARALHEAGHAVAFAAREIVRPRVETLGFPFFAIGSDFELDGEFQAYKAQLQTMPSGLETELFIYTQAFCGIGTRLMAPDLIQVGQSWQPDMFIREVAEYGGMIAAEYLGRPHITVAFTTALKGMTQFEQHAASQLDPIRQSWGLAPDPDLKALYRYLHLAFAPPNFSTHDVANFTGTIPPTTHFIRPQFFDTYGETLPEWVARLPAQPTIYVTMGTEINGDPNFYPSVLKTIIEGLRDLPINLIVTLGRGKNPADFGEQPANVHIEPYIPQSLLLPHCDLMVMHGGSNSVLAALEVGLPLVIIPLIADQFFNAHITQAIGLGTVVEQVSPTKIRAAVEEVLGSPSYRQKAWQLQAEMHALPDLNHAVKLIEEQQQTTSI